MKRWQALALPLTAAIALTTLSISAEQTPVSVIAPGATPKVLHDGFQFTEGPAADKEGNVFFTDVRASRIHKWSTDGKLSTWRENTGGANGLYFDEKGNLYVCAGDEGRIVSISPKGELSVLADTYDGAKFNKPNDLWIDPKGGVYFSDPAYGRVPVVQGGEHVYYLSADRKRLIRVIEDHVRPNGLIGTPDGKTLYVTDNGAKKTYRYKIKKDGTLSDKTLFVSVGSDGMTLDNEGNLYITSESVLVFNSKGKQIEDIKLPNRPTNVCFGGTDRSTLFITARTLFLSLEMRVKAIGVE